MSSQTTNGISRRLVYAVGLMFACGLMIKAQNVTGSISGVVEDPQGAVVPNAKITLTNDAQGAASTRIINTNADGVFVFSPLIAGTYTITVEMMGFKKLVQSNIILDASDRLGLPALSLEVGATGESITVEAAAIQLQTLNAERSAVVTGTQMVDIAINGRNYTSLLRLVPGVTADNSSAAGDVSFNGGRTAQSNYTVDGQNVTDIGVNQTVRLPHQRGLHRRIQGIQQLQTAEFGRNDGAQIQVVTKGGTQGFPWRRILVQARRIHERQYLRNNAT